MILPCAFMLNACGSDEGTEGLEYLVLDQCAIVTGASGVTDSNVVIPETYKKKPVVEIDEEAFKDCTSITSVTIPDSVTTIKEWAFYGCTSLTSIVIPDSVTTIELGAFWGCTSLTSVTTPYIENGFGSIFASENDEYPESLKSLTLTKGSIRDSAFEDCKYITDITLAEGVTKIGSGAFEDCESLVNIKLPASVTEIGEGAFSGCSAMENVYYNGTLDTWCALEFENAGANPMLYAKHFYVNKDFSVYDHSGDTEYELCETIIHDTINSIGDFQFYGFDNLSIVTIPKNVTSIGENAFYGCPITDVYYTGTEAEWLAIDGYDELVKDGIEIHYNATITK